jgi:hypothetical protein
MARGGFFLLSHDTAKINLRLSLRAGIVSGNKQGRNNLMGYYKNLAVAKAEDPHRFMAWYRANENVLPAPDMIRLILGDQSELWERIEAWESTPEPKKAVDHVALNTSMVLSRRDRRRLEKAARADQVLWERLAIIGILLLLTVVVLLVVVFS